MPADADVSFDLLINAIDNLDAHAVHVLLDHVDTTDVIGIMHPLLFSAVLNLDLHCVDYPTEAIKGVKVIQELMARIPTEACRRQVMAWHYIQVMDATLIMHAAASHDALRLLLSYAGTKEQRLSLVMQQDCYGRTALAYAAMAENPTAVRELLAMLDTATPAPLTVALQHMAMEMGGASDRTVECCVLLLNAGADLASVMAQEPDTTWWKKRLCEAMRPATQASDAPAAMAYAFHCAMVGAADATPLPNDVDHPTALACAATAGDPTAVRELLAMLDTATPAAPGSIDRAMWCAATAVVPRGDHRAHDECCVLLFNAGADLAAVLAQLPEEAQRQRLCEAMRAATRASDDPMAMTHAINCAVVDLANALR